MKLIREYKPKCIINTAAYTAVDKAESEKDVSLQTNGQIMGIIGEVAKKIDASVIHYSTDYVFNGASRIPYTEDDHVDPINHYGKTKLLGEKYLLDTGCQAYIFRVSWVYGKYGNNFLKTILKLMQERPELKIVSDQIGAPTFSYDIAKATVQILSNSQLRDKTGIYHMPAQGQTTWYDFTQLIVDFAKQKSDKYKVITESVVAISSDQFITPAVRPRYSLMSGVKLKTNFQITLPEWDYSVKKVLAEM